jgi:hypothetical protein
MSQDFVRDSSQPGRSRSRVQDATPGPQFDQTEQNVTREGRGQGRRDREIGQGGETPKAKPQSFSNQRSRRPSDVQERRFRPDSDSAGPKRSSPSPNRNSSRSQQFKHSVSNAANDSGAQVRRNRGSSGVNKSQSSRAKVEKSQGSDGSRQAKSGGPSRHQASQNYSRPKGSHQSARVERSGGQSRQSAPSYSKQGGRQSASAAGKSRGGGKNSGGKKASQDRGKNKD